MNVDLISREAALDKLRAFGRRVQRDTITDFETRLTSITILECINIVKESPAVNAEPVRHERWELVANREYCPYESEIEERCTGCGRHVHRYGTQPQDEFCPTCGAKMDGGADG